MAKEITDANIAETLEQDKLVVIDFWAEWCGPCRMVAPTIEALATEFEGKAIIGKVDVDTNPEAATRYGIRNIPTILFIKGGQVIDKHVGAAQKAALEEKINKHL